MSLLMETLYPYPFSSFGLLKENYKITNEAGKQADNNINWKQPSNGFGDHVTCYMEDFLSSKSQPLSNHEIEDAVEGLKHEENCELIQGSYVPLSFGSLYFLKKNVKTVMKPAHKKIENIDEFLRNKPLRWGNLLYITQMNNSWMIQITRPPFYI